jgi:hypothetical protein
MMYTKAKELTVNPRYVAKRSGISENDGDAVDRERQHLRDRILRRAAEARVAFVLDADLLVADPTHEAAQEAMFLARLRERVDHAPAHQAKVARVDRDRDVRQAPDRAVEDARGQEFEEALAAARLARGVHHVVALAPLLDDAFDQFGRILQIAVHQDHRIAARGVEPGGRGDLMSEVAREIDDRDPRICRAQRAQRRERTVARAVVDRDDLVAVAAFRRDAFQNRRRALDHSATLPSSL